MHDLTGSADALRGHLGASPAMDDRARTAGRFQAGCRDADGTELWSAAFDNLLTTVGKNFLLDTALAGSAYTAAVYMGLISSASYSAVVAADTMASHAGWLEAGSANAPTFSGTRLTVAWSAASAGTKATSGTLTFTFTGSGTVEGAFLVLGTGASSAIANTSGTLYAEGVLGTPQPVISGNTLTLTYSSTLT